MCLSKQGKLSLLNGRLLYTTNNVWKDDNPGIKHILNVFKTNEINRVKDMYYINMYYLPYRSIEHYQFAEKTRYLHVMKRESSLSKLLFCYR